MPRYRILTTAAFMAAVVICASPASAAFRSSEKSCREAVNGLISLLDAKTDDTALYRDTYSVVVDSCGPRASSTQSKPGATPPNRDACHGLAAVLVDLIEDGKMNTNAFAEARGRFAQACAPR
jgi:hypothetical protein